MKSAILFLFLLIATQSYSQEMTILPTGPARTFQQVHGNEIFSINGKDYYTFDVLDKSIKCKITRTEGNESASFTCRVIRFFFPLVIKEEENNNKDQWLGDQVFFFGITDKPFTDVYNDPNLGVRSVSRNTVFLKTNSFGIYQIDWDPSF